MQFLGRRQSINCAISAYHALQPPMKKRRGYPHIRAATRSTRGLPSLATELNHSTLCGKIALISINSQR
jgi:hypothetical protein